MEKNKHMTLDIRQEIENGLNKGLKFKEIARITGKDCTTISKEVRNHYSVEKKGGFGVSFNDCLNRIGCTHKADICHPCSKRFHFRCASCGSCRSHCKNYIKETCSRLKSSPYVCNGCSKRNTTCTLERHIYRARSAHEEYETVLRESRSGFSISEEELKELDSFISPLLKSGQSLHHIAVSNPDRVTYCEKTLYTYANNSLFKARNLDMPRKVRLKPRKKSIELKVDKGCRIGRTFKDYQVFLSEHPGIPTVQLDTVEGKKGGSVLLTIHFVRQKFQLAFKREHNDSASVIDIFNSLYALLGPDTYRKLFPVLLADNGTEFSNPAALEFDRNGNRRSFMFYCDPSAPYEKGACEVNHELIRRVIPKGTDISPISHEQISLAMSHINSYTRAELGDKTPFAMMRFYYGSSVTEKLGIQYVKPNDILLKPRLLNLKD